MRSIKKTGLLVIIILLSLFSLPQSAVGFQEFQTQIVAMELDSKAELILGVQDGVGEFKTVVINPLVPIEIDTIGGLPAEIRIEISYSSIYDKFTQLLKAVTGGVTLIDPATDEVLIELTTLGTDGTPNTYTAAHISWEKVAGDVSASLSSLYETLKFWRFVGSIFDVPFNYNDLTPGDQFSVKINATTSIPELPLGATSAILALLGFGAFRIRRITLKKGMIR